MTNKRRPNIIFFNKFCFIVKQYNMNINSLFDNELKDLSKHATKCDASLIEATSFKLYFINMSRTSSRLNSHSIVCLNVKELLARSRCHIDNIIYLCSGEMYCISWENSSFALAEIYEVTDSIDVAFKGSRWLKIYDT